MAKGIAVIGANFGDEGKGVVVDALASRDPDTLVVRFNGGAQAGHTVTTPEGVRHVFHHFGSGTLAGCETYLSRHFVVNPILFVRERIELVRHMGGSRVRVHVDDRALVTTPYDMLINRGAEIHRGDARHGSCGLGINETVVRSQHDEFRLVAADLADENHLRAILWRIRFEWLPYRLRQHGMAGLPRAESLWASKDELLENYVADCREMTTSHGTVRAHGVWVPDRPVVFEGAQGLWLDEELGYFPHVTRARTGLRNVLELCREMGVKLASVCYVTRPYFTRHGAGPLPGEVPGPPYPGIRDETNAPNPHQGPLRFAPFDLDHFRGGIARDRAEAPDLPVRIAVTCLDQVGDEVLYTRGGEARLCPTGEFPKLLARTIGADPGLVGYGPTRNDVVDLAEASFRMAE